MNNLLISIALCGDPYVGKTCFFQRFSAGEFNANTKTSIGCDVMCKKLTLDGKTYNVQLWDTAGQEVFRSTTTTYFRNRHCILFTYDITKRETLEHVEDWMKEFCQVQPDTTKTLTVLIGCKSDLEEQRQITSEEGESFANTHQIPFFECSAKNNTNITEIVEFVVRELRLRNMLVDINPLADEKKDESNVVVLEKATEATQASETTSTCC
ncbi:rab6, putative [Entamoeba invadens IP1]|uniref:Rab6, putative n=1 Tax=Entamoeba invadens IP1 TaxID=370355 RepID=A0A0A1UBE4_ENTIV|nr:rab6, putative [Entamoeba invadens IP1]ELP89554.1 rab6, putative [Entamoeba invadens IP1]|eukprot:XP_004256325.1 rab6, putative [Entamoeba invadens IP1]